MADDDYARLRCGCGSLLPERKPGPGRPRKYCLPCAETVERGRYGAARFDPCAHCGAVSSSRRNSRYCSTECRDAARAAKPKRGVTPCIVDGCERKGWTKGLCSKHYSYQQDHGTVSPGELVCGQCHGTFISLRKKTYCSKACCARAQVTKKAARKKASRRAMVLPAATCAQCMASFVPRSKLHIKFCSVKCKKTWHYAASPAKQATEAKRQERQVRDLLKLRQRQEREEARAQRRAAEAIAKAMLANRFCSCGAALGANRRKWCTQCAANNLRDQRRAAKDLRKARIRGAGDRETVYKRRVFQRDGWHCKLCGIATPRELVGTYEHNAPELDHVVPVSRGGAHTYANTQCLCRSCNGWKGARTMAEALAALADAPEGCGGEASAGGLPDRTPTSTQSAHVSNSGDDPHG